MYNNFFSNMGQYLLQLQLLDRVFQSWGYHPVIVPMMDAYAIYDHLRDAAPADTFRVLDPNGNLMLLRSDTTLFLAKMLGTHLQQDTALPLRLCYSNNVMQSSKEHEVELWQSGIELVGVANVSGDFEIITLLDTALQRVMMPRYCIHIGSRNIVDEIMYAMHPSWTVEHKRALYAAIEDREHHIITRMLGKQATALLMSIVSLSEFEQWKHAVTALLPKQSTAMLRYSVLIDALSQTVGSERIRCDLSEIGTHEYYTDTVYSVYVTDVPSPVARGGRYDKLMEHFGVTAPAIGCTLFPHVVFDTLIENEMPAYDSSNTISESAFNGLANAPSPSVEDLIGCATKQQRNTV